MEIGLGCTSVYLLPDFATVVAVLGDDMLAAELDYELSFAP